MMWLVKLIDLVVGAFLFLFSGQRRHNPSIPLALGLIGTIALITVMLVSIGVPRAWYQFRTNAYGADLANASGLTDGDPVYVAGVPAGRIEKVALAGDHVRIDFRLDKAQPLGNRTTATVRLRTVLGKRFLDVMPAGAVNDQDPHLIPLSRTTVPYSLDEVGRKAAGVAGGVDQQSMADMMKTLSSVMSGDNQQLDRALAGISSASAAFTRNGDKVDDLLRVSRSLSQLLAGQTESLTDTAANAQLIITTMAQRRHALTAITANLTAILHRLAVVYRDKGPQFATLIDRLTGVTATLKDNADKIDQTLLKLPPSIRAVVNATGNGNWADVNSPSVVMPDNMLCALNIQRECR